MSPVRDSRMWRNEDGSLPSTSAEWLFITAPIDAESTMDTPPNQAEGAANDTAAQNTPTAAPVADAVEAVTIASAIIEDILSAIVTTSDGQSAEASATTPSTNGEALEVAEATINNILTLVFDAAADSQPTVEAATPDAPATADVILADIRATINQLLTTVVEAAADGKPAATQTPASITPSIGSGDEASAVVATFKRLSPGRKPLRKSFRRMPVDMSEKAKSACSSNISPTPSASSGANGSDDNLPTVGDAGDTTRASVIAGGAGNTRRRRGILRRAWQQMKRVICCCCCPDIQQ